MVNNEYINKVIFGDTTIMDISDTTAEAEDVVVGKTFYAKSGAQITGTLDDATQSTHGLMSAADKTKLDSLTNIDTSNFVTLNTNQTINGIKIFTNSVDIKNHLNNPYIDFYSNENNNPGGAIQLADARDGTANYATGQFKFKHYAPSLDGTSILGTSESYVLPPATPGLESSASYYIYTTKNVLAGNNISITGGSGSSNITIAANIPVMAFATTDTNGTAGLVPAPSSGTANKVLAAKGWASDNALQRGNIPENADLDTYITDHVGIWRITSNADAATMSNIPESKAGILQVINGYNTSNFIQIYYRYDVGSWFWIRRMSTSAAGDWCKYLSDIRTDERYLTTVAYDSSNKKITKTLNDTTSDVVTVAKLKTDMSLAKGDVGLSNVENKSSATIRGEITSANVTNALGFAPAKSFAHGSIATDGGTVTINNVPNQSVIIVGISTTYNYIAIKGSSSSLRIIVQTGSTTTLNVTMASSNITITNNHSSSAAHYLIIAP